MKNYHKISVVVPFYNEEGNVEAVLREVAQTLRGDHEEFEIIAVDDASGDTTGTLLRGLQQELPELRIMTHGRNLGQAAAFWTGFQAAQGDVVVTMDGDGQNDFNDVPRMLALLDRYDGVFGQRARRQDPVQKLIASRIAFFFRRVVLNDPVRDTACALKVMKKDALVCLLPLRGIHRFFPFLFQQAGLPYTTLDVNHRPRRAGKTKYSLLRGYFLRTIPDLLFMWWYKKSNFLKRLKENQQSA